MLAEETGVVQRARCVRISARFFAMTQRVSAQTVAIVARQRRTCVAVFLSAVPAVARKSLYFSLIAEGCKEIAIKIVFSIIYQTIYLLLQILTRNVMKRTELLKDTVLHPLIKSLA